MIKRINCEIRFNVLIIMNHYYYNSYNYDYHYYYDDFIITIIN